MDRRSFLETCSATAACLSAVVAVSGASWASSARPREYARAVLVDERGEPLKAAALQPQANYVFNYPFEATPVFLLDLGKPVSPNTLTTEDRQAYVWPGGVGSRRSIVAFCAICTHELVYPTREVSFISFRKTRALRGVQDGLIHCCADHSQFDPARGAEVLAGPARQPLCAVLLEYDPATDGLAARGTLGGELFDRFFAKYAQKLSLDVGPDAHRRVAGQAVVRPLERYCRNPIQC